jgi:Uma2 family endonuclease
MISSAHALRRRNAEEEYVGQVAASTKVWTFDELHSLPDDGNKYELIHGELFVTPAPSVEHETVAARLSQLLSPYIAANGLGLLFRPRAVFRYRDSEVEPDLMVRQPHSPGETDWARLPTPRLVVEIGSPSTWRRDRTYKRDFYLESGISEYWILDTERRTLTVIRPDADDVTTAGVLQWQPLTEAPPLAIDVAELVR